MTATSTRLTQKQKRQLRNTKAEGTQILDKQFGMKKIVPLTETQSDFIHAYEAGQHIAAIGTAGTGKTYLAMYLALKDVLENNAYKKVLILRSAVQLRDIGHLPGDPSEKDSHYELPYVDTASDLFGRGDAYGILKQKGQIKFTSTSFIRGMNLNNTIIIADECQSMSFHELDSIITRVGEDSKIIFCGDTRQNDLIKSKYDVTGLPDFLKVLNNMNSFEIVKFTKEDIVRSGLVKEYIYAKEFVGL